MLGGGPGIFPICPFPLSRPLSSAYEEQSRKGPRHNQDLSRKNRKPRVWKPLGLASPNIVEVCGSNNRESKKPSGPKKTTWAVIHPSITSCLQIGRRVTKRRGLSAVTGAHWTEVTKQKHRSNRQNMSKICPKIVFFSPSGQFWDIFRTFFRHLSDILSTFPFSGLFNDVSVTSRVLSWRLSRDKRQVGQDLCDRERHCLEMCFAILCLFFA